MDVYLEASGQADGRKCPRPDEPANGGDGDSQDDRCLLQGQETAGLAQGGLWREVRPMLVEFHARGILYSNIPPKLRLCPTGAQARPRRGLRRVHHRQIDMVFVASSPPS